MNAQRGRLVSGGRLQVPADIRRALGLEDGDPVMMRVVDGELHVRPIRAALARVQARLRPYVSDEERLSDALIADRRRSAEDE
ncbi:AbrB/MazE/SpoVT family DNA-binding domain-containing protein [Flavisphingomonas formosensis]|uniref:AbrB/MazE/SpoVT family DNA-binding domain-containing protein n=1 Tax=Flavisphingomonas formosensis TaxID=861534 RepID=UPI0012F977E9|nr:AbrB/MazE/SpoVT family DNA-binding domain-containing protein [Sphingomonas formosensis]